MYTIDMFTNGYWVELATVDGCEAAYAAYRKACELGEMLGREVALCDAKTGEVLANLSDEGDAVDFDLVPMPTAEDLAEAWWEG